jgi:hypothetical protein
MSTVDESSSAAAAPSAPLTVDVPSGNPSSSPTAENPASPFEEVKSPVVSSPSQPKKDKSDFLKSRMATFDKSNISSSSPTRSEFNKSGSSKIAQMAAAVESNANAERAVSPKPEFNRSGSTKIAAMAATFNQPPRLSEPVSPPAPVAEEPGSGVKPSPVGSPQQSGKKLMSKISLWEKAVASGGLSTTSKTGSSPLEELSVEGGEADNNGSPRKMNPPPPLMSSPSKKILERMQSLDLTKLQSAGMPPPGGVGLPGMGSQKNLIVEDPPEPKILDTETPRSEDNYEDRLMNRPKIPKPRRRKTVEAGTDLIEKLEPVDDFENLTLDQEDISHSSYLHNSTGLVPNCCTSGELNFTEFVTNIVNSLFAKKQPSSPTPTPTAQ